jgi:ribonuclease G
LSFDRAKYDILGISKFGLVEMTRERIHKTVHALSYQDCSYCQGKGKVKSPLTMSIYALKLLKRHLNIYHPGEVTLTLNPGVSAIILKDKRMLQIIERKFRTKVTLLSNPSFHVEEVRIS